LKSDSLVNQEPAPKESDPNEELVMTPFASKKTKAKKSLQDHFQRFKKKRSEQIKYKQYLTKKNSNPGRNKEMLRQKFVETAKKYYGVPYAKRYHKPGDKLYDSPLFLDCCALVRQVVYDMREDLGFFLDRWNQGYQYDTLPIDLKEEEMKPGDLVFYSAIYFSDKKKKQKHNMVHVEIFMGGETGEQSIGARWQKGVVQLFDSYKFKSTSYHSIQFHYKSIDTWLEGVCRSWCDIHSWKSSTLLWHPNKKSIFTDEEECTEADLEGPGMEGEGEEEKEEENTSFFVGRGNNNAVVKDALIENGLSQLPKGMDWSDKYRFKWVQTPQEVNFMRTLEGKHIVNHISNCWIFTNKVTTMETIENLGYSVKNGDIETSFKPENFFPETYKLGHAPDLVKFLNQPDEGYWLLKKKNSNCGRGITLIQDVKQYKDDLVIQEAKVEKPEIETPVEADNSTDILLQKMKEMGIDTEETKEEEKVQEIKPSTEDLDIDQSESKRKIKNIRSLVKELKNVIIQKYESKPCLYKGKKFDIRSYMVINCTKPYLVTFNEGYCRISLNDYTLDDFNTKEGKITHMTNNSVQKKHPEYKTRKEETIIDMQTLKEYLVEKGFSEEEFQNRVINKMKEIMRIIFLQVKDNLDKTFG